MEKSPVQYDLTAMEKLIPAVVRERAMKAGGYITYMKDNQIVREDPRTGEITILKDMASKPH